MPRTAARRLAPLLLLVLAAVPARAEDGTPEQAWHTLVTETTRELDELARTYQAAKLFAWRNETYEQLLLLDADHAAARNWLKYRRAPDGTWQRGPYKAPRNLASPTVEHVRLRAAVGGRFADRALELLAEHRARVAPAKRLAILRIASRLAPMRQDIHAELGEVRTVAGTWVLRESLESPDRRRALAEFATSALEAAPAPTESRPTTTENVLGLGWNGIHETGHARLLGTVDPEELRTAAARIEASHATFLHAFDIAAPRGTPLTLYMLASGTDRDAILGRHPAANDAYRAWAKKLQSSWLPKTSDVWVLAENRDLRLEWCSRQITANLLWQAFGIRGTPGWAFEGCGLYLSHLVAGQRRTFFVKRTEYATKDAHKDDLWDRLREKDTDWRKEALALLTSDAAPDLRLLLGKQLNDMNTEDMLTSYVVCAFLIEGRPRALPALLESVGRGKKPSVDVLTAAGLDPETLGATLRRWLEETR